MRKGALLLVFTFLVGILLAGGNLWVKKATFGGDKRERAVAFSIGNKGYVCGGQDTANIVRNDLWEYSPASNTWAQKADLPGVGRRNAVAFAIGNKGYVGTGMSHAQSSMGSTLADMWEYDPITNSWLQKANYPGGNGNGVYFATAFVLDEKAYICCGKIGGNNYLTQLWEYKPSNDTWTQRAPFPGTVRYQLSSFTVHGRAYVGWGTDQDAYRRDVYEYFPPTNSWTQKNDFPGYERNSACSFNIGNRGFISCGGDGGYLDDLWEYNFYDDSWSIRANFPGGERRNAFCFVIDGKAYLGSGKGFTGLRRNFYEYTPYEMTGVEELSMDITVYPNPCTDFLVVNSEIEKIRIYRLNGTLITDQLLSDQRIDVSHLSTGIYVLEGITPEGRVGTKKFIKQ